MYTIETQRCNRIYATTDTTQGGIYKVKENQVKSVKTLTPKGNTSIAWMRGLTQEQIEEVMTSVDEKGIGTYHYDKKDKMANSPEHCIIDNEFKLGIEDIDKSFYIDMAKKRIKDYLGGTIIMPTATKKTTTTTTTDTPIIELDNKEQKDKALFTKISNLRKYFDGIASTFLKDGYNSNQKYEYVKAQQYKTALRKGCLECGLEYKCNIIDYSPITLAREGAMTCLLFKGIIILIDIETGNATGYNVMALGADSLDKQASKAETLMIKDFVKGNFLMDDNEEASDPEATPALPTQPVKFTTPEKREDIKKEIVATENTTPVETGSVDYAVDLIKKIREKSGNPNEATNTLNKLTAKDDNGNYTIDKLALRRIVNSIEERANDLGVI